MATPSDTTLVTENLEPRASPLWSEVIADHGTWLIMVVIGTCLLLALVSDLEWSQSLRTGQLSGVASQAIGYLLVLFVLLVRAATIASRAAIPSALDALGAPALRRATGSMDGSADIQKLFARDRAYAQAGSSSVRFVAASFVLGVVFMGWRWESMNGSETLLCALGRCGGTNSAWNPIMSWQWLLQITLLPLSASAIVGLQLWPVWRASRLIAQLVQQAGVHVLPGHPDGCGGLAPIGRFCIRAASPLLGASMVLGLNGLGVALGGLHSSPEATAISSIAALGIGALCWVSCEPVWLAHRAMLQERRRYEAMVAVQVERIAAAAEVAIEAGRLSQLEALAGERESLRRFYPDAIGFPLWPLEVSRRYVAAATQLFGIIGSGVGLYKTIAEAVGASRL